MAGRPEDPQGPGEQFASPLPTPTQIDGLFEQVRVVSEARARRIAPLVGPSVHTPENEDRAFSIRVDLEEARIDHLKRRTSILSDSFPSVYIDAFAYMSASPDGMMPWATPCPEGEQYEAISARYGVAWSRERPDQDSVPPMTDIFYESAEVAGEWLWLIRHGGRTPHVLRMFGEVQRKLDDRFKRYLDALPPEERKLRELTPKDIADIKDLTDFAQQFGAETPDKQV